MMFHSPFLLVTLSILCIIPAHSSGNKEEPAQPETCLRLRMDKGSLTVRQVQAWFCAMSMPSNTPKTDAVDLILSCMADQGILPTDDDIKDFVLILPHEECIDDILETSKEYGDQDPLLMTNIDHEDINNITDAVLCARFLEYNNGMWLELKQDKCFVHSKGDIACIRQKQRNGEELSESDKDNLREHYFKDCSSELEVRYRQNNIMLNVQLVSTPHQCQDSSVQKLQASVNSAEQVKRNAKIFAIIGFLITAVGLIGAVLSLSVFCRPSFLERHHVGYLCIERSICDIFMLVYCAQTGFGLGRHMYLDSGETMYRILTIMQCSTFFLFFMPSEIGTMLVTLAISVQRLLAVATPLKAKVYLNKSVDKKICIAVLCISMAIPIICLVVIFLVNDFDNPSCVLTDVDLNLMFYFSIAWSVIFIALPWLIIIIVTMTTLYHITASRKNRNDLTSANENVPARAELHKEDLVMVILIGLAFLIALAPEILLNVVALIGRKTDKFAFSTTVYIELSTYIALALKSSLNFLIYFASNAKFREIITGYVKRSKE